ncbi:MAG: hypothetical protein VKK80_02840 [Prochlorothrix sp.]|nr:hypothetical protein [Prochlorothrix sp.]
MINSLLQIIKDKFGSGKGDKDKKTESDKSGGKGGSKGGGKGGSTLKRKSSNVAVDDQWAAAIEAINAASQGKPETPPATLGTLPVMGSALDDEDEQPTMLATSPPPLTRPPSAAPPSAAPPSAAPPSASSAGKRGFPPRLEPIIPLLLQEAGLRNLSAADFKAIGAYLAQRSNLDKDERKEASLQLARQMKTTMAMAKLPQKMSADLFLEALYAIHRSNG